MNYQNTLVSVVIPVYNRAHLISRTLNSVLNQTHKRLEVIIVDDCSNDSSELVKEIEKFSDLNIKYIRHEVNKHGGGSRNTGIDAASGEYIAFLDSDDVWMPEKIQDCIVEIIKSKVDFVFGQLNVLKEKKILPTRGLNSGERLSDYILLNGGTIQTSTIFIKSDVAKKVRFDDNLKRFQDYDFVVSLEKNGSNCHFINKCHAVMYDDDQVNRISNSYDPTPAILWANKISADISSKALSNFYIKRIVRYCKMSGQSIFALKILLSSHTRNASTKERMYWFIICCMPIKVINIIKSLR
ncbi:glycosyltransferase family 2 protein [Vibrio cholerae]|uniref:glycosyltransferase family 2 protein n=1 Tax=Vibrio cholerae TaxID=666 RepID=UPI0008417370|nr:glycosyltransferase family 2 protein [Vibrio cholerae]